MCAGMTRQPERTAMPLWLELLLMLACSAMVVYCIFFADVDAAHATPFLWVSTTDGNDSSANPFQPNSPLRTYARAISLGANGDTLGVKIKPGSAPPSPEEAYIIMGRKPNIVRTHAKKEVIAGHGLLPDVDREESAEAGIAIVRQWVWVTSVAANGQPFEYCANITTTVEDF